MKACFLKKRSLVLISLVFSMILNPSSSINAALLVQNNTTSLTTGTRTDPNSTTTLGTNDGTLSAAAIAAKVATELATKPSERTGRLQLLNGASTTMSGNQELETFKGYFSTIEQFVTTYDQTDDSAQGLVTIISLDSLGNTNCMIYANIDNSTGVKKYEVDLSNARVADCISNASSLRIEAYFSEGGVTKSRSSFQPVTNGELAATNITPETSSTAELIVTAYANFVNNGGDVTQGYSFTEKIEELVKMENDIKQGSIENNDYYPLLQQCLNFLSCGESNDIRSFSTDDVSSYIKRFSFLVENDSTAQSAYSSYTTGRVSSSDLDGGTSTAAVNLCSSFSGTVYSPIQMVRTLDGSSRSSTTTNNLCTFVSDSSSSSGDSSSLSLLDGGSSTTDTTRTTDSGLTTGDGTDSGSTLTLLR